MKTITLYFATALAEILGCYLPWLWLKQNGSPWLLIPAAISLATFAWLLTLHEAASGRVYAAYGGVYICTAILWLAFRTVTYCTENEETPTSPGSWHTG